MRISIITLILLLSFVSISPAYQPDWQRKTQEHIDTLMTYLCDDIKILIANSSFEVFKYQQLDVSNMNDECKKGLEKFYYETNSLFDTEKKINIYDSLQIRSILETHFILHFDRMFKSAIYEKISKKEITALNWRKRTALFLNSQNMLIKELDSLRNAVFIEGTYIPENLEEALILALELLDDEDLDRIDSYKDDEECYWGELDLSAKKLLDKWFLLTNTRLTTNIYGDYYPKDILFLRYNGFFISGLIIVALKNRNNNEFDIREFIRGFELKIPFNRYTKPVRGEIYEFIVD